MDILEERVIALETLLKNLIPDIRETRIAIGSGFAKIDENFTKIDDRFAKIDERFIAIEIKIDKLSGNTEDSFKVVDSHLSSIKDEISKINSFTGYEEVLNNLTIVQGGK